MDKQEPTFFKEKRKERGEITLTLQRAEGDAILAYRVCASETEPKLYSVTVEYTDAERHTQGEIPHFSSDKETAERFCAMLARFGVTPLSLDAIYEDTLTP